MTVPDQTPSISVVIPTRNRPGLLLERALPSALGQTYTNIEIIVVIDGPDPLTERALATVHDSRLRVLALPENVGGSDARNAGVRASRGEWIAFLDDDDEWLPEKLEWQLRAARASHYPWPVVACNWITRTPSGDTHDPSRPMDPHEPVGEYLTARKTLFTLECCWVSTLLMMPRALLLQVPFTPGLPKHQDWDWLLRVDGREGVGFEMTQQEAAIFYYGENRPHMSRTTDWRWSLEWARQHHREGRLTNKAYVGFIVSQLAPFAAQDKSVGTFRSLLWEIASSRPRPFELLRYFGIWLLPGHARRELRVRIGSLFPRGRRSEAGLHNIERNIEM